MKIVITGGHLSPALSVIEALPTDTQILYIGRKFALEGDRALSLEYQKITLMDISFVDLKTGRLQRRFTKHTFNSLLKLPQGFFQAFNVLQKFKPDAVVCFGGYLQIPVAFAAHVLRIPVIIHEQTMRAGLANKIIAPFAKTICISWPESEKYFPKGKTILTGLPLRKEFLNYKKTSTGNQPSTISHQQSVIYITGGSLGAHAINVLAEGIIEKLLNKYYIIHQTGDAKEFGDYERLEKIRVNLPAELREKYKLFKFIDPEKTAGIMANSDLIISRAGINTVAELIYLRKICILIPLPHGQYNEQLTNAEYIQKLGFGKVLKQDGLRPEILYSQIVELTDKLNKTTIQLLKTQNLINYDAAEKIVKIITKNQEKN